MDSPIRPTFAVLGTNDGHPGSDIELREPSAADLAALATKLDGVLHDQLLVEFGHGAGDRYPQLSLAGGGPDGVVLEITIGMREIYVLTNPDVAGDGSETTISSGACEVDVPSHYLVGLDSAIDAASHFLLTGQRHPGLQWERE